MMEKMTKENKQFLVSFTRSFCYEENSYVKKCMVVNPYSWKRRAFGKFGSINRVNSTVNSNSTLLSKHTYIGKAGRGK